MDNFKRISEKLESCDNSKSKKTFANETFLFKIEPALVLHYMTGLIAFMVMQNLMLEKACLVNLGYSTEVCAALKSSRSESCYIDEEISLQVLIGELMLLRSILENIFPMFLVILIGAWSDKYGRKLPMLFVVSGYILQSLLLILCNYSDSAGGWSIAVVTSLIPGLTGNQACFSMSAFTYITDTTPVERITLRTTIAHSAIVLGISIGFALGGFLASSSLSYTQIYSTTLLIEVLIFIYIALFIKSEGSSEEKDKNIKTASGMLNDIFEIQHIKDAFKAVFRSREGNVRKKLLILLCCHFFALTQLLGEEESVLFLFGRHAFDWGGSELGSYLTFRTITTFFGDFILISFLSGKFGLSDPALGICGCISTISASILYFFIQTPSLMYLGPILGILGEANMIVPRAILSKLMPSNEMGKVSSFLACLDSMVPLISAPIYTFVYTITLEFLPSAFFLISATVMIPIIISYNYFLKEAVTSPQALEYAHKKIHDV